MENSKLIQLIKALSEPEIKEVRLYLESPFHNTDPHVAAFFKALCRYYPDLQGNRMTKAGLFKMVFKNTPYDDKKLRKLMSKLTKSIQAFMVMKEGQEAPAHRLLLVQALARRGAQQLFEQEAKTGIHEIESNGAKGIAQYRELAWYYHLWHFSSASGQVAAADSQIVPALENTEHYFVLAALEYHLEVLIRSKTREVPAPYSFFNPVCQYAAAQSEEKHPVIALFFQLQELYAGSRNDSLFQKTYQLYLDIEAGMSRFERQLAWKILCQYLIRHSNDGHMADSRFLFDLYKSGLEKGMLAEQELIRKKSFTNIALAGIMVYEFDWALDFVDRYHNLLDTREQEATKDLVMAYWNYYRATVSATESESLFKEASRLLQRIPYSDEIFYLRIYSLRLRLNYDYDLRKKQNPEELKRTLKNFKRYLDGKTELSNEPLERYRQFSVFLEKLAKLSAREKDELQKMINSLVHTPGVAFRHWLLTSAHSLLQTV
ncbi:MAG: hypothetical protein HUU01_15205 [Saprospiraceae bacterium]|nr:hypothetical protein [Saprospiraceae bacterium]